MGYYTHHELDINVDHTKYNVLELLDAFREKYNDAAYALNEDGSSADSTTWYDAEDQLCDFSNTYPDVLFTLHGEGEKAGDIWNLYVMNGKGQKAKAKFKIAEFDPAKLK